MVIDEPRVRPHVAAAVRGAQCLIISFDGVLADVRGALGGRTRDEAVHALLAERPYRPRPQSYPSLAYLAAHEPDNAADAERIVTVLEIDAALTARPTPGFADLLLACAETGRRVAVLSDLAETAVTAMLRAHQVAHLVDVVAARQGLDPDTFTDEGDLVRAATLLDARLADCLTVSGSWPTAIRARDAGTGFVGVECGRDSRKWLAGTDRPVVSRVTVLTRALRRGQD